MFRGVNTGNVDDKGRLKLPASVNRQFKENYKHGDIFITSLDGETVKMYPIEEWKVVEALLSSRSTGTDQASDGMVKNRILFQVSRFGAEESLDNQGRLLVPAVLRDSAGMRGTVVIQWQSNHLVVMSEEKYNTAAIENKLTAEDLRLAANLGL